MNVVPVPKQATNEIISAIEVANDEAILTVTCIYENKDRQLAPETKRFALILNPDGGVSSAKHTTSTKCHYAVTMTPADKLIIANVASIKTTENQALKHFFPTPPPPPPKASKKNSVVPLPQIQKPLVIFIGHIPLQLIKSYNSYHTAIVEFYQVNGVIRTVVSDSDAKPKDTLFTNYDMNTTAFIRLPNVNNQFQIFINPTTTMFTQPHHPMIDVDPPVAVPLGTVREALNYRIMAYMNEEEGHQPNIDYSLQLEIDHKDFRRLRFSRACLPLKPLIEKAKTYTGYHQGTSFPEKALSLQSAQETGHSIISGDPDDPRNYPENWGGGRGKKKPVRETVVVLGRRRNVVKVGRSKMVNVKGQLVKLSDAIKREKSKRKGMGRLVPH